MRLSIIYTAQKRFIIHFEVKQSLERKVSINLNQIILLSFLRSFHDLEPCNDIFHFDLRYL